MTISKREFDNNLNSCLDRMLKGETVEQCLAGYPEQARELEPLLRTASAARAASAIQPRATFKARARAEFQTALRQMEARPASRFAFPRWRWEWHSAWGVAIVAVLLIVATLGGTVTAAVNSMPGNGLYGLKLATEKVQMALTFSEEGKARLNATLATKRVDEIVYSAAQGDAQQVQVTAMRLDNNLAQIRELMGVPDSLTTGTAPAMLQATEAPVTEMTVAALPTPEPGPADAAAPPSGGETFTAISPGTKERNSVEQYTPTTTMVKKAEPGSVRREIVDSSSGQPARLEEALNEAPAETRPAIQETLGNTVAEYQRLIAALNQASE